MKLLSLQKLFLFLVVCSFDGCLTMPEDIHQARVAMFQKIEAEPRGDYFIGRRYFKPNCKFWGYVRRPGQSWSTAQLVMLNEKWKLAPDRAQVDLAEYEKGVGFDNNYEYKLHGYFSGEKVYELVSNDVYPEFVLKGYELISTAPPPIFESQFKGLVSTGSQIEKPQ